MIPVGRVVSVIGDCRLSYSGGIPAPSIVDCRLLRPCNRLITDCIRWPETLRHTPRMRNVDPIAFSAVFRLLYCIFQLCRCCWPCHIRFSSQLQLKDKLRTLGSLEFDFLIDNCTDQWSTIDNEIQVKPKNQRLVSQSTKVQFIKRLPGFSFDLENKFNYAETKKKKRKFVCQNLRGTYADSKAICQPKINSCDEDKTQNTAAKKIATNIRVWRQTRLTLRRPINPLPFQRRHQCQAKRRKKSERLAGKTGQVFIISSLFC